MTTFAACQLHGGARSLSESSPISVLTSFCQFHTGSIQAVVWLDITKLVAHNILVQLIIEIVVPMLITTYIGAKNRIREPYLVCMQTGFSIAEVFKFELLFFCYPKKIFSLKKTPVTYL